LVIKIHQTVSTKEAFNYNEKKVEKKHAHFFISQNTLTIEPFVHTRAHRLEQLLHLENNNQRCKNKCFHVSVNPTNEELETLTKQGLKTEIDAFMKYMGYGHQPYFVYEHSDLKRTHYHIVSTRINAQSGKKINDSTEKRKVSQFITELQQRYELGQSRTKLDKVQLIPTIKSANLHEGIQQVFKILNKSNITGKQEYLDILRAFNLEIYQSKRGLSVLIKDQDGQTLRHPITLSSFKEQPNLFNSKAQQPNMQLQQELKLKTEQILKGLNKSYRFYTNKELREAFIKHNFLPYKITKNGNLNVYSPLDKTVVDAQFLFKKNTMRLQEFTLSNDQFYRIVREFTNQQLLVHDNVFEALVDKEQSIFNTSENRKIVLKELNLEACEGYKQVASQLNSKEQKIIIEAVQSHLEYMGTKAIEKIHSASVSYRKIQEGRLWDKVNHQFLIELLNYQDWNSHKSKYQRKKNSLKRRRGRRF